VGVTPEASVLTISSKAFFEPGKNGLYSEPAGAGLGEKEFLWIIFLKKHNF
jgi:hypothetical protein